LLLLLLIIIIITAPKASLPHTQTINSNNALNILNGSLIPVYIESEKQLGREVLKAAVDMPLAPRVMSLVVLRS